MITAAPLSPSGLAPCGEGVRLNDLQSFDILDTPHEEPFDGIVEVAAALLGVPYALITLMDAETQWFKASTGTDLRFNAREQSFCNATIQGHSTLVVPDATRDARFANLHIVTGLGIRFYAGTPLISNRGQTIGTICALDVRPRKVKTEQIRLLERLARQTVDALESRRLVQHLLDEIIAIRRATSRPPMDG